MAEIIDFLEYKRKKEEAEVEQLRRELQEITILPPEPLPYYAYPSQEEPYYTYDSFYCWPSPHFEKGSYGRSVEYDEREYLFSELWPGSAEGDENGWE
tara:strand:- start:2318 stop:2611 length:294 start_codon:yes stop_codon:yes gene_type:complete